MLASMKTRAQIISKVGILVAVILQAAQLSAGGPPKLTEEQKLESPVITVRSPEDLGRGDETVTALLRVQIVDAEEVLKVLNPLLPDGATLSVAKEPNGLVFIGPRNQARRMMKIVRALDLAVDHSAVIRIVSLRHTLAETLAPILKDIFGTSEASANTQNVTVNSDAASAPSTSAAPRTSVQFAAVADEKSNSLILRAGEETLKQVEQLIEKLDVSSYGPSEIRIFPIHNADAYELLDIVDNIFSNTIPNVAGDAQARMLSAQEFQLAADMRTNALLVKTDQRRMEAISALVATLDADPRGKKKLVFYSLDHADPDAVAQILLDIELVK